MTVLFTQRMRMIHQVYWSFSAAKNTVHLIFSMIKVTHNSVSSSEKLLGCSCPTFRGHVAVPELGQFMEIKLITLPLTEDNCHFKCKNLDFFFFNLEKEKWQCTFVTPHKNKSFSLTLSKPASLTMYHSFSAHFISLTD